MLRALDTAGGQNLKRNGSLIVSQKTAGHDSSGDLSLRPMQSKSSNACLSGKNLLIASLLMVRGTNSASMATRFDLGHPARCCTFLQFVQQHLTTIASYSSTRIVTALIIIFVEARDTTYVASIRLLVSAMRHESEMREWARAPQWYWWSEGNNEPCAEVGANKT